MTDGAHYLRQEITLRATRAPLGIERIEMLRAPLPDAVVTGYTDGAVLTTDKLFLGVEHPLAGNTVQASGGGEKASDAAGMGAWLSPWGGYGGSHDQRVAFGRNQGYETNVGGFALGGPKYYRAFRDVLRDTHWIGGHPLTEIYGYAAWHPQLGGTLVLRNPTARELPSTLDLQKAFELPPGTAQQYRLTRAMAEPSEIKQATLSQPLPLLPPPFAVQIWEAAAQ